MVERPDRQGRELGVEGRLAGGRDGCRRGRVRQLDAGASRFLVGLAGQAPIVPAPPDGGLLFVDVDDTIIEAHGPKKQGAGFGYSGVRGLNALLTTVSTETSAPVIIAQRLRRGSR